jgi:hypothetical protein
MSIQHVGNYLPNISAINVQSSNHKGNKLRNSMINSPATTTAGVDKNSQELATSIITRQASNPIPRPNAKHEYDIEVIQKQYWDYQTYQKQQKSNMINGKINAQ